jgi:hypothetical protein
MTGRGLFGTAVLFTLTVCLFAAGAQAEQRAWTCAPEAGTYSDAHCKNNVAGTFKAVEIANGTATEGTLTNEKTAAETTASGPAKLFGTLSGLETEIQCATVIGSGSLTNSTSSVSGTGIFQLSGCKVTKPAGRNCSIRSETMTTRQINSTTSGQPAFRVKFEPVKEKPEEKEAEFLRIPLEGCKNNKPPTAEIPIIGSLVDSITGATTTITRAESESQGMLTFGGQLAAIEGALTARMKGGNPIFLR